ncbi:MAG: hypothetical protein AB7E85_07440 [Pseudobdellovibrionaceae bacterium]
MIDIPIWVFFGLGSAAFSAVLMLVQERVKGDGLAIAYWNKLVASALMIPFLFYFGVPTEPMFYVLLCGQALIWVVSDVIFFNAIPKVGAGSVSRILPVSVIFTFFLWFLFDPALLGEYLEEPWRFGAIILVLLGSVYFSMRIKKCAVSWEAVRVLWFVIVAAIIGPLAVKLVMQHTPVERAPWSWVFFEGTFMLICWTLYILIRKPIPFRSLWTPQLAKAGLMIGATSSAMVGLGVMAYFYVDNPGYIPAVKFLDTVMILIYYRMIRHKEKGDVTAGLAIVVCAALLILLKSSL